ncbi:hemolysin family protein [Arcanobacterium hippocoleae]|uniref:CBS domain containing-hemolysin-like protein n=1 Tax=Arcanobacterium hippocoleae TaxID=149017 RepID=A0ABU1T0L4_9ACTO|nr:hemolysin family protein [Arcanobacterium hippocoleae]MDR6938916.1 CBS domain containing-hemolysin-like protein [Arcanobacterium hippocoleae]
MHEIANIPFIILIIVAISALIISVYFRLVLVGLNRLTRSSVKEAIENNDAHHRLIEVLAHRPAAKTASHAIRVIFISLFAISLILILVDFISYAWLALLSAIGIILISYGLFNLLLPSEIAVRKPLKVVNGAFILLWPLTRLTSLFVRKHEPVDEEERETQNEDQIALMVERVSESEAIEDDERSLINSVFELSRTIVRAVMVPRTDMITINQDHTLDQAISLFSRSGFSRVPVIGDSADELLGVIYLKDTIQKVHRRPDSYRLSVTSVMRQPTFVPETMVADDLLHKMQATAVHMAIVVDEYGGIAGLITIEDLLEELVGEMVDEHDQAQAEVVALGDGVFRVPARMPIDDFGALFGKTIEDDDVDTVGGLLSKNLGRVPIVGSFVEIFGIHIEAERYEGRRKRIATVIASPAEETEAEDE